MGLNSRRSFHGDGNNFDSSSDCRRLVGHLLHCSLPAWWLRVALPQFLHCAPGCIGFSQCTGVMAGWSFKEGRKAEGLRVGGSSWWFCWSLFGSHRAWVLPEILPWARLRPDVFAFSAHSRRIARCTCILLLAACTNSPLLLAIAG